MRGLLIGVHAHEVPALSPGAPLAAATATNFTATGARIGTALGCGGLYGRVKDSRRLVLALLVALPATAATAPTATAAIAAALSGTRWAAVGGRR